MTHEIDERFLAAAAALRPAGALSSLNSSALLELFDSQAESRHLDFAARELRAEGAGFYTIGSGGHEGNAAIAAALRPSDPALLHYRSGAFYLQRARQRNHDGVRDVVLGLLGAAEEPIAGGRHKVFGNAELAVIPLTSTIASHLPRAVGLAFGLERARKLGVESGHPADALVACSFGDASANHSTAAGAINTACHVAYQGLPLPLLLICEDNGIGVSVRTPPGWIQAAYGDRPGLRYFRVDGAHADEVLEVAVEAARYVRERRRPAFLHMTCVRFMGHAGSDAEVGYRGKAEIVADYARDPLLGTARLLVNPGFLDAPGVVARYEAARDRVRDAVKLCAGSPQLPSAGTIMAPIAPRRPDLVAEASVRRAPVDVRRRVFGARLPEDEGPLTLATSINRVLADLAALHRNLLVFGEDVGRKGGVYGVTRGLQKRLDGAQVFDTLLDEQSILGLALGAGLTGLLPVPEIQYLAYLHNAEDQLRGEAATLQYFSQGAYRNPMVVRVAGYAYQKGFGGHFHNDNAIGVLRDIPGIVIASPSRPDDAAAMLRTCVAAAEVDGSVCVFLEPIALYHTKDLYADGDGEWLASYPSEHIPIGRARVYGDGGDLTLVTFGNGVPLSLRAAKSLAQQGISTRVLDLRWLAPLPIGDLLTHAEATGNVLVVDETRRTGGVSEGIITALVDAGARTSVARVTSKDSFVPLGDAALHVLVSEQAIREAATRLLQRGEA